MAQGITITHKDFMFATAARKPFDRPGWIFDLKYDGFRVQPYGTQIERVC